MRICEFLFVEEISGSSEYVFLESKLFIRKSAENIKLFNLAKISEEKYPMEEFLDVNILGREFQVSPHDNFPFGLFFNKLQKRALKHISIKGVNVSWLNIIKRGSVAIFGTKITILFDFGKRKIFTEKLCSRSILIKFRPNPFISKKARKNLRVNYEK